MSKLDLIEDKLDPGYVFQIKTRNSTREKKLFCITNNKVRRNLFCHLLSRVRTRRSRSVLPRRFSVLKSCLTWVPLFMLKKKLSAEAGLTLNLRAEAGQPCNNATGGWEVYYQYVSQKLPISSR